MARFYPRRLYSKESCKNTARIKFTTNADGKQLYARDSHNNEVYPPCKTNIFARDERYQEYYARDCNGNQIYPVVDGMSLLIPGKLARYANGDERYPYDEKGNEYYLLEDGKPYLLKQWNGETYFAKNRKGIPLIPWNFVKVTDDRPFICTRDVGGTSVYVHEPDLPQSLKMLCNCLCQCATSLKCPSLLNTFINTLL